MFLFSNYIINLNQKGVHVSLLKLRLSMLASVAALGAFLTFIFGLVIMYYGPTTSVVGGITWAVGLALITTLLQWYIGPWLIKMMTQMRELDEHQYKWIHEFVEATCKKHGIAKPKLYIVNDVTPNAFAFGRTKNNSNIAIHVGLLERLNKEEVEAVLAHEIGHVCHWDVAVITAASLVPRILYFLVLTFFVPRDDHGRPTITGIVASYIAAFAVELVASLMVRWLSRTREMYADEFSARATHKPRHLETALAKIGYAFPAVNVQKYEGMRQFYLADPVNSAAISQEVSQNISHEGHWIEKAMTEEKGKGMFFRLFSTHPPTYKRIENLRELEKNLT